jgi:C4-type Zn-finger protein
MSGSRHIVGKLVEFYNKKYDNVIMKRNVICKSVTYRSTEVLYLITTEETR